MYVWLSWWHIFRQQVSENESEIEKLSEALKKKDEKEKKYQGMIYYIL